MSKWLKIIAIAIVAVAAGWYWQSYNSYQSCLERAAEKAHGAMNAFIVLQDFCEKPKPVAKLKPWEREWLPIEEAVGVVDDNPNAFADLIPKAGGVANKSATSNGIGETIAWVWAASMFLLTLIPILILLKRGGYSAAWAILFYVPLINILLLWYFALKKPKSDKTV